MKFIFKYNTIVLFILFLTHLIFSFAYFGNFQKIDIGNFLNSDSMYLPSLYKDFFIDGNSIEGTHFNPAPNLFPDMLVYFAIMFITGGKVAISSFIFAILQYFLLFYLLNVILKHICPDYNILQLSVILFANLLLLLEVFYLQKNFIFIFFMYSNSYHTGSFILALLALIVVLKYQQNSNLKFGILLFVLVFLGTFSDQLFLVQFVAPLVLTSLFCIRENTKPKLILLALCVIAVIASHYVFGILESSGKIFFNKPSHAFTKEAAIMSFNKFFSYMKEITFLFGYRTISIWLFVLSYLLILLAFVLKHKKITSSLKYAVVFLLIYCPSVIFAALVTGIYTGYDTLRYNIYPLYLTGLLIIISYRILPFNNLKILQLIKKPLITAISVVALITAIICTDLKGVNYYFNYYPRTAQVIDSLAVKENLKCGAANYWFAKSVRMFCKSNAKTYAVFDNLAPYTHIANENWYFNNKQIFNFILVKNFSDTNTYKTVLKDYKIIYNSADFKLIKTNEFRYNKETYAPYF